MDSIVSRLYLEKDIQTLSELNQEEILDFLRDDEKNALALNYWVFEVNQPVRVSLMRDQSQKEPPFWLSESEFTLTEMVVKNEHSTYEVWQKHFDKGMVRLGINGFDKHRPVYFISLVPIEKNNPLKIEPIFPESQQFQILEEGAFTYHDWDGLKISKVPTSIKGEILFTTIRGRAREAHLLDAFRHTDFPSGNHADQIMLSWQDSTQNSISIQCRTNPKAGNVSLEYWQKGKAPKHITQAEQFLMEDRLLVNDRFINRNTFRLNSLLPNTEYEYRIMTENGGSSDIFSFKTAPCITEDFSFLWFGDMHNDMKTGEMYQKAMDNFPESAFVLNSGDLVGTGLYRNDWDQLFGSLGNAPAKKPFMAVPGNHDSQDGLGAWMFREMFDYPKNGPNKTFEEFTYHFFYSNTLFLMMDGTLPIKEQKSWLEQTLKNHPATWKILTVHFPLFNSKEPYEDIQREWLPTLEKYGIDLVFSEHFHYYMRSKPLHEFYDSKHQTVFVHSASTKGKGYEGEENRGNFAAIELPNDYMYQKIDISSNSLKFQAFDFNGKLLDSFQIKK
ncbi:metallophosphoesterase family protein [Belliella sp. R4-6]|uniref:Metallophosphoesterase family protein n=1 Tax=Belliella alkalica TaxID=1730871 RepID=A0ABS9VFN4_9BACT|nr:metallophosphoesterase family protein [Belliella alkalica]MCH7415264.1 metallophosphoesterase family protein [Belliella alkalica]